MKAGRSEGPKNERTKLNENLEQRTGKSSETAGRDNCGHHPGWPSHAPGDVVAPSDASSGGEAISSADSPQKAMYEELMEQVVTKENATAAWLAVKRNGGAPGIDGMTTGQLRDHVRKHWETIRAKLLAGTYVPSPVRRVEIPKPNGGTRLLGIPTVLDRWIQQMLLQVLQPIFDPTFSEHSYGFRPGRSAHDAVRAAQTYVQAGKDWVVDMDITKFFDRVNHDILMNRIGQTDPGQTGAAADRSVPASGSDGRRGGARQRGRHAARRAALAAAGQHLPGRAGPRTGPERGLAFCRYADDCNIYVGSQRAAERVLASITDWISKHLRLEVNATKSGMGRPWERKFLGFRINPQGQIEVAPQSVERFKRQVRELWRSCQSLSSERTAGPLARLRARLVGLLTDWPRNAGTSVRLEGWIRRHIRSCFWQRWHDWRGGCNDAATTGTAGTPAQGGAQFPGRVADRGQSELCRRR